MNVVILLAQRAPASALVQNVDKALRRAAQGQDVSLHLVSWGPAESPDEVASNVVVGPTASRAARGATSTAAATSVAPLPVPATGAPDAATAEPGGVPAPGEPQAPGEPEAVAHHSGGEHSGGEPAASTGPAPNQTVAVVRNAPGHLRRGLTSMLWRVRLSPPYQFLRRLVRGGLTRQYSLMAPRNAEVVALVRSADVVIALDAASIPAAWRLGRKVPGPPVVFAMVAGECEVRALAQARADHASTSAPTASANSA